MQQIFSMAELYSTGFLFPFRIEFLRFLLFCTLVATHLYIYDGTLYNNGEFIETGQKAYDSHTVVV